MVEASTNITGPKESESPLKPEQEIWPENPNCDKTFIIPNVPPLSEGAPAIAALARDLPGTVTVRQLKSAHYQPHIEQKLVHVTPDGTVTGVTLGTGSVLHPCTTENHQWFRLEAVTNDSSKDSRQNFVLSTNNVESAATSTDDNEAAEFSISDSEMTVLELETPAFQDGDALKQSDLLNNASVEVSLVNDELSMQCVESCEVVRQNQGILSVSQAPNTSISNCKKQVIRCTHTWVT